PADTRPRNSRTFAGAQLRPSPNASPLRLHVAGRIAFAPSDTTNSLRPSTHWSFLLAPLHSLTAQNQSFHCCPQNAARSKRTDFNLRLPPTGHVRHCLNRNPAPVNKDDCQPVFRVEL